MKHFYKLLFAVLLLPLLSAAQSNYRPGYVVTLKGDTLHGFIDFQGWDSNPTSISFKPAINDRDKRKFTTGDISFFNVDGFAAYKKFVCAISMDATNSAHLNTGRDTSFRIDTVFLKILQKGKNLALYAYADNLKVRFYIGEAPGYTPTELVYRLFDDTGDLANKAGNTVTENTYQKQLFALANKYNALDDRMTSLFEKTAYDKDDLLAIVSRINNISKAEFEKKYTEHGKFSLYAGAAANISTTSSAALSSYTQGGGTSYTSTMPAFAIGVDFIPDPAAGRAELRLDLSVNPAQLNAMYKLKVSPYSDAKTSYSQLGIFFTPQALYNIYNDPNFKFYLGAGIALTYFSYSNPYFGSQPPGNNAFPIEPFIFNKVNNAFLIKAGFRIQKNWEIYFDYYTSAATTQGGYFGLNNVNKLIGVNYFFGK